MFFKPVFFLLFWVNVNFLSANVFLFNLDSLHCDCNTAKRITLSNPLSVLTENTPLGFGTIQEINSSNTNHFVFEKEHNTAWYKILMSLDGEFSFEVIPADTEKADVDFVIYKYSDTSFCKSFLHSKLLPLRSNLSRNNLALKGKTGLSFSASSPCIKEGIGEAYSKPIKVKKGEQYMLVIDDVYGSGKEYTLKLICQKFQEVHFKGEITNQDSVPIPATIILSDETGKGVIEKIASNEGKYDFKTTIEEKKDYTLTFDYKNSFPSVQVINTSIIRDTTKAYPYIKTILPKLQKGRNYAMGVIQFYGDSPDLLPISNPSVYSLYKLMKEIPEMKIQIEGHVHDISYSPKYTNYNLTLSQDRAKTVYNYLVKMGINKERVSTVGLSNTKMLYPHAKTPEEEQANRRVEIKVVSVNGE